MTTIILKIAKTDLAYFDKFLSKAIMKSPVNSLRAIGQYDRNLNIYHRMYEVLIRKDEREIVFEISLSATSEKVNPLDISTKSVSTNYKFSKEETKELLDLLTSRIREAEKNTKLKPMKTFEYEAHLSTSIYPLKSTIKFGKYKLIPSDKRDEQGWGCKLRYFVESIDEDFSLADATLEAKTIAAWLSVIYNIDIRFKGFSKTTPDPEPIINYETIKRPDLRPVKHAFAEELKIPYDFISFWKNFYSLPPEIKAGFISSCLCYQVAMDLRLKYSALSYQLFVTAVEVIAKRVVSYASVQKRFIEFICRSINQIPQKQFQKKLEKFYGIRSAIVHENGIGFGFLPSLDIRTFDEIPGEELWELETIVNAALLGFLENPFKIEPVSKKIYKKEKNRNLESTSLFHKPSNCQP